MGLPVHVELHGSLLHALDEFKVGLSITCQAVEFQGINQQRLNLDWKTTHATSSATTYTCRYCLCVERRAPVQSIVVQYTHPRGWMIPLLVVRWLMQDWTHWVRTTEPLACSAPYKDINTKENQCPVGEIILLGRTQIKW